MTDATSAVRLDLGTASSPRMLAVAAQLRHLFPAAPFGLHIGYGAPPAGFREVEAWRVIPNRFAPRFLVPVDPAGARRLLLSHNGLRSRPVAASRRLASLAMAPTAAVQGERGILRVSVPADVDDAAADQALVTRQLRRRLPEATSTAVSLRDFHPRAKPTVQLLDATGRIVAFAKVASDLATAERVRVEADLLRRIGVRLDAPTSPVRLPRVLDDGQCGPFAFSVVEPLPARALRAGAGDQQRVLPALEAFGAAFGAGAMPLAGTALWHDVMARVEAGRAARGARPDLVGELDGLVAAMRAKDGEIELPVGCYHGDWVPWNLGWADGDVLWVWDLEYGSTQGPLGLDALRWVFQVEHVLRRRTFAQAVAAMTTAAPRLLNTLGVDPAVAPTLARLHVVETMGTALGLLAAGRGLPRGLDPDAVHVMRSLG